MRKRNSTETMSWGARSARPDAPEIPFGKNETNLSLLGLHRLKGKWKSGLQRSFLWAALSWTTLASMAQETFPVNGVADPRDQSYALTHATVYQDARTVIQDATILVRKGKIVAVGSNLSVPADAVEIDCKGKFIYPSFIDAYSDYGIPAPQRTSVFNWNAPAQLLSNQKGAYGWNQAIRSDVVGARLFQADPTKARQLRELGFGAVLTHQKDGIVRGTGTVVSLADQKENMVMLKEKASAHYSFSKGTSSQTYPSSLMGSIALLRQTYIDAAWYRSNPSAEGVNITLRMFNEIQQLPQIFEANDKWNALRADRIGDEFGVQYIVKGGGNEYQRIQEMKASGASFILSLDFPEAMDVEDPLEARFVALSDLKHWEMAPSNIAAFEKNKIPFALTSADLRETRQFLSALRKAIQYGLTPEGALEALTTAPAKMLGIESQVGTIAAGKWANFLVTNGPIFDEKTVFLQNWVQGEKYSINEAKWSELTGTFLVKGSNGKQYTLEVKSGGSASYLSSDTVNARFSYDGTAVKFSFAPSKKSTANLRFSGVKNLDTWQGTAVDEQGKLFNWTAVRTNSSTAGNVNDGKGKGEQTKTNPSVEMGKMTYPFNGYGFEVMPQQEVILIRNTTVWTNEQEGVLKETDVLIKGGKIAQIGKGLTAPAGARIIDGTNHHLTAGIIDEHSHIAVASINEGGQSVTSEVRIADNLNPDDINIYRQLSGGVTSSHILHGSANTIGGQTQLIKLRWGANDEELKFKNWDGFIKFALGENVKRSSSQTNNRFPDTRMGVDQVLDDAFQRATDYRKALQAARLAEAAGKKGAKSSTSSWPTGFRRDLELEALVEIMEKKRFITCHSYVQSEITAAMRIGEKYGFVFNTFTHILEGYKVADKMKAHGANASTFSDWWQYKMEVVDAIPYNATIMQRVGLNVAINSDDAEMARRLNQEAAKSVKYGGMSEEDALKMVTLNPAIMLRVADRVGSIKVGKDADVVLWNNHPLSIYARAEKTIVDGVVYYDRARDTEQRKLIQEERNRIMKKMLGEKRNGMPVRPAEPTLHLMHNCGEHNHDHGLLVVEGEEL